jgi:hypothetical protein
MPNWKGEQSFCIGDRKKTINLCEDWAWGNVTVT